MSLKQELLVAVRKEDTAVAESLRNSLYKFEIYLLKVIPVIMMAGDALNTFLSLMNIEAPFISYICGISAIPLLFLLVSSYVFKFCIYHRLPLYYIIANNLLNIYDWYIGIPIGLTGMILTETLLVGITIFLIIYLYVRNYKKTIAERNKRH